MTLDLSVPMESAVMLTTPELLLIQLSEASVMLPDDVMEMVPCASTPPSSTTEPTLVTVIFPDPLEYVFKLMS